MKREIKFRAWTRQGEWDDNDERRQFIMIDGDSLCPLEFEPFKDLLKDIDDEYYVMQYTGLKDKNGKEIYEGDILHRMLFDKTIGTIDVFAQVLYNSKAGLFEAVSPEGNFFETVISDFEWQVVGNIYENPELL